MTNTSQSAAMRVGERRVVLLLALQEADVLEQDDLARIGGRGLERPVVQADGLAQQARERRGDRRQRERGIALALLRAAEVRHDEHARAFACGAADRRQRGAQARVARDLAVGDRHVQVLADQHALAGELEIRHADRLH